MKNLRVQWVDRLGFNFKNLISPYEVLESPDARKLGILMKNIKMSPV